MQVAWIGVRWEELHPTWRSELASDPVAGTGLVVINDGPRALGIGLMVGVSDGRMKFDTGHAAWRSMFEEVRSTLRRYSLPLMAGTQVRLYIEQTA